HGPAFHGAVDLQAEVIMQSGCPVFLNDEAGGRGWTSGRSFLIHLGRPRLGRPLKIAFLLVAGERIVGGATTHSTTLQAAFFLVALRFVVADLRLADFDEVADFELADFELADFEVVAFRGALVLSVPEGLDGTEAGFFSVLRPVVPVLAAGLSDVFLAVDLKVPCARVDVVFDLVAPSSPLEPLLAPASPDLRPFRLRCSISV